MENSRSQPVLVLVDAHSGVPIYRQIMDQVRLQVAGGALAPGVELPSTRALSAELGVNPMTVSKAYSLLEREGVIERRPGQTLVVAERTSSQLEGDRVAQLRASLAASARLARQLNVAPSEATRIFEELLNGEVGGEGSRRKE